MKNEIIMKTIIKVKPASHLKESTKQYWGIEDKIYNVVKEYWYNGEGHYKFDNGKSLPSIFFEEMV